MTTQRQESQPSNVTRAFIAKQKKFAEYAKMRDSVHEIDEEQDVLREQKRDLERKLKCAEEDGKLIEDQIWIKPKEERAALYDEVGKLMQERDALGTSDEDVKRRDELTKRIGELREKRAKIFEETVARAREAVPYLVTTREKLQDVNIQLWLVKSKMANTRKKRNVLYDEFRVLDAEYLRMRNDAKDQPDEQKS